MACPLKESGGAYDYTRKEEMKMMKEKVISQEARDKMSKAGR